MIDKIIEYSLTHRLLTILLVALVSVWGVIAYMKMPKDIYPDLNAPLVKIITENPGMAAEDVERLIADAELMIDVARLLKSTAMAETMFHGVRVGGHEVFKRSFSWGFGRKT